MLSRAFACVRALACVRACVLSCGQERLPSKDRRLMQNGGDMPILQDYDVTQFHTDYIKYVTHT